MQEDEQEVGKNSPKRAGGCIVCTSPESWRCCKLCNVLSTSTLLMVAPRFTRRKWMSAKH
jgi:hypothetical protein